MCHVCLWTRLLWAVIILKSGSKQDSGTVNSVPFLKSTTLHVIPHVTWPINFVQIRKSDCFRSIIPCTIFHYWPKLRYNFEWYPPPPISHFLYYKLLKKKNLSVGYTVICRLILCHFVLSNKIPNKIKKWKDTFFYLLISNIIKSYSHW